MTQCFYLIGHDQVGDDFAMDKVFIQKKEAVLWGRRYATRNSEKGVYLFKQEMTRKGNIQFVKQLEPFPKKGADSDIDKNINNQRVPIEPFDWDKFDVEMGRC